MAHSCDIPGCTAEIAPVNQLRCTPCSTDPRIIALATEVADTKAHAEMVIAELQEARDLFHENWLTEKARVAFLEETLEGERNERLCLGELIEHYRAELTRKRSD